MLKSARQSQLGNGAGGSTDQLLPHELDGAGCGIKRTGDQVEAGALAGTIGPDQTDDFACVHVERHIIHGHQSAEGFPRATDVEHRHAFLWHCAMLQAIRSGGKQSFAGRDKALQIRHQSVACVLQDDYQQDAEHDNFKLPGLADDFGQQILQPRFEQRDERRAEHRAPHARSPPNHRHEQIFNTLIDAERRRVHKALQMRVQPARQAGQHGRNHKHGRLGAPRMHAKRLDHRGALLQGADGATGPRIKQVGHSPKSGEHHDPDEIVEVTLALQ